MKLFCQISHCSKNRAGDVEEIESEGFGIINIKLAIQNRLGGDLYKEIYKLAKANRTFSGADDPLVNAILEKKKYLIRRFFLGFGMINGYYQNLYSVLCGIYSSKKDDSLFDFNGIIIPKPNSQDIGVFIGEFTEFFIYYVIDNYDFCDLVTDGSPYELADVKVDSSDIVIDCGANIGLFSAIASRKGTAVYAFEPSRYVIDDYLSLTAKLNPNIHICEYALSNKQEQLQFLETPSHIGCGKLDKSEHYGCATNYDGNYKTTIQAITLDTFVHENNLPRVDFIKADIEGAERYMLMGAKQVLKDFAPKLAICTYHLPDDPKVLRELILDANPNYVIEEKFKKMYAHVPR